jgi:hypothetical protein
MKITPPSKQEIKAMRSLYKKLHAIEKQIVAYKKEVCAKRCPLKSSDIIRLPDGSEGLVISCEAYADYSKYDIDYPNIDIIGFHIRYLPIRKRGLLREYKVTIKWREITIVERDSQRAKDLIRKRNGQ